jgi:MYXO-CTERM domain-containing protein
MRNALTVMVLSMLTACGEGEVTPPGPGRPGDASVLQPAADPAHGADDRRASCGDTPGCGAAGAETSHELAGPPNFDLGAVVRQVHFAFRPSDGARFRGGHTTYTVDADGAAMALRAWHAPEGETGARESEALHLTLISMERGGRAAGTTVGAAAIGADGALTIRRGDVVEHLRNGDDGVEQSWSFASEPSGSGPLRLSIRVGGMAYVGATDGGLHFADATGLGFRYGHATWVDADGVRVRVPVQWSSGTLLLEVPHEVLEASAYPAVLDPLISPELGMDEPVSVAAQGGQTHVKLAWGGTSWLAVWGDTRGGVTDVYGARIARDGTVLDRVGLAIAASPSAESLPAVAFGGTAFLVVWQDDSNIYGARVAIDGTVLDPAGIAISTGPHVESFPAVVWDGTNYVVAWQDTRNTTFDVYSARVSESGVLLDPMGISVHGGPGGQVGVTLASNGGGTLVAWADTRSGATNADIYASRLSTAGVVLDPAAILVSSGTGNQTTPDAAWDGSQWFVVWSDERTGSASSDIAGARISSAGVLLDVVAIGISSAAGRQSEPSLTWNGTTHFVTWRDHRAGNSDVYAARVTAAGTVLDPAGLPVHVGANDQVSPRVAFDGTNHLVAWVGTESIDAVRVSATGTVLDASPITVSTAANEQLSPSAAWGGSSYLVVWSDRRSPTDSADIYGVRLSATGTVLDPTGIAISTAVGQQVQPALAWDGTSFFVVWGDQRGAHANIYGARVSSSGTVLDPTGIPIDTTPAAQRVASVAWNGSHHLVIWEDRRDGVPRIYATRVRDTGAVVDAPAFAISSAAVDTTPAAVASDGTGWLAVWTTALPDRDIYGARVNASGVVMDPSGLPISTAIDVQFAPGLAWNGSTYLVAWRDLRAGTIDVRATRVSSSGVVADPAGILLATAVSTDGTSVASDARSWLVAWRRDRQVRGSRVSSAGTVETPEGALLAEEPGSQIRAYRVTASGPNVYLLTYQRYDATVPFAATRVRGRLLTFLLPLGAECTTDADCESGFCTDAVCCNTRCAGGATDCQACAVASGAAIDGVCGAAHGVPCRDGVGCLAGDRCEAGTCVSGTTSACDPFTSCSEVGGGGFTCTACPAGTFSSDGTGSSACSPCAAGSWSTHGARSCLPWSSCSPGEYVSIAGSATSDRTCAICPGGTWSGVANAFSCVSWSNCPPGTFVMMTPSATNDRACTACAAGSFSSTENASTCTAWTSCMPGSYVVALPSAQADRVCEPCAAGRYTDSANQISCAICRECAAGEREVRPCSASADRLCAAVVPDGGLDAGASVDAGAGLDAGATVDAGAGLDAGASVDAGAGLDAGASVDAGDGLDAGAIADGGLSIDSGTPDSGRADAGMEAPPTPSGCTCRAGSTRSGPPVGLLLSLALLALWRRRR